jgi:hypothetical protein
MLDEPGIVHEGTNLQHHPACRKRIMTNTSYVGAALRRDGSLIAFAHSSRGKAAPTKYSRMEPFCGITHSGLDEDNWNSNTAEKHHRIIRTRL